MDELIRCLESIQAEVSFITSYKLFHRFKDFYDRPAKFIHPSPKTRMPAFHPRRKAKGPLYLRQIRFTCRKRNLLAETSTLLAPNEIYLQQSSLYLQNPLFTCRIQYFTCSKPVLFAKSRSLFNHIKTRPLGKRPGINLIYLANLANTVWNASTVLAMCSSVCAVDRNMPSNWDGGKKMPSSAIKR